MPKAFTSQVVFTGFSSRVDGSVGFRGVTPELTAPEKASLFELHNVACRILIEPNSYEIQAKVEVRGQFEAKSPSQRLRAVLFILWKECAGGVGDFEQFYRSQLEEIIESVKSKLPENH